MVQEIRPRIMKKPKLIKDSPRPSSGEMVQILRRHIPEVTAIEQDVFPNAWKEEDFITCLQQRNWTGKVYQSDNTVLGYVLYSLHKRRIHIENLAVRRDYWCQGIGRKMINRLYQSLNQQRRTVLSCDVWDQNTPAHLFLQSCGFTCRQILPNYYSNGGDGYLFHRLLAPTDWGQE